MPVLVQIIDLQSKRVAAGLFDRIDHLDDTAVADIFWRLEKNYL